MIDLKSPGEIKAMKTGGKLLSEAALELREMVAPGITTLDLDKKAVEIFNVKKLKPAFLNYGLPPYPATICTSVNDEIVHGIPSVNKILEDGDIISIDLGGIWENFCVDMAFTAPVGRIPAGTAALLAATRDALEAGIAKMYTSFTIGDVSWAIQEKAEGAGYSVVRELVGHGIGRKLHEAPNVPNYGRKKTGIRLQPGLVLALEPMLNEGAAAIQYDSDGWTVRTADGRLSSHFEHTVAVTAEGPVPLTEFIW